MGRRIVGTNIGVPIARSTFRRVPRWPVAPASGYLAPMPTTIDERYTLAVLRDLVRIDSVNPSLVPGAAGEAEIAGYVSEAMRALDCEVAVHEHARGRFSVVGTLPGTGGGRSLMLNAHMDTVGVDGMDDPFGAEVRGVRLYGRGAYDMKGSLAGCLAAVKALRDTGTRLAGDVLVAAVADEEHASLGTQDIARTYAVDGAIVTEPTSLRVCLAHKGFVWLEVETHGRAAHGSRPELGIDANARMGRVLARLEPFAAVLRERSSHSLVGPASMHAATLRGGSGLSTYAASCVLGIERRTIPGETVEACVAEVQSILDAAVAEDPSFSASLRLLLARSPFEADPGGGLVRTLAHAVADTTGEPAVFVGETPWMDSALLADAGVETVVIGPHGSGAHAAEEWVDLDSVVALADILAGTARAYCETDV
jgi:acetylornithine deacetylase